MDAQLPDDCLNGEATKLSLLHGLPPNPFVAAWVSCVAMPDACELCRRRYYSASALVLLRRRLRRGAGPLSASQKKTTSSCRFTTRFLPSS